MTMFNIRKACGLGYDPGQANQASYNLRNPNQYILKITSFFLQGSYVIHGGLKQGDNIEVGDVLVARIGYGQPTNYLSQLSLQREIRFCKETKSSTAG